MKRIMLCKIVTFQSSMEFFIFDEQKNSESIKFDVLQIATLCRLSPHRIAVQIVIVSSRKIKEQTK